MPKSRQMRTSKSPQVVPQLTLSFPRRVALDPKQRAQVVTLLSRLLLHAARREHEVADDVS